MRWLSDLFGGTSAEVVFLSIFGFGLAITLASLAFGGDDDGDGDHGHFDHDHGDGGAHGPGMLSIRGISLLAIGFGGVGYLVQNFTGKLLFACVAGLGSGWGFAAACLALMRLFYSQQGSSLITAGEIQESRGVVTTSIPRGGRGEVMLSVSGKQMSRPALSSRALKQGTPVRVLQNLPDAVLVEPVGAETTEKDE